MFIRMDDTMFKYRTKMFKNVFKKKTEIYI